MASTFKTFTNSDMTNSRSLMHEAIPITGSLLSGSYGSATTVTGSEPHIKTYSHGMFQSIYDYPHVSSSANHLFDMTFGFKTGSFSGGTLVENNSTVNIQPQKKLNVYNQLSQILVGYNESGSLRKFDKDGNFSTAATDASDKIGDVFALCFSRLLVKDEIKKGSFSMTLGVHKALSTAFSVRLKITDDGALTNFRSNSPAGEYGFLKAQNIGGTNAIDSSVATADLTVGLIYYQAGIVVLDFSKIFSKKDNPASSGFSLDKDGILDSSNTGISSASGVNMTDADNNTHRVTPQKTADAYTIDSACNAVRSRIQNVSFNNTTELNSTVYFCRMNHNEFNYSSNPTYLTGSQIRVKEQKSDMPRSYVSTIGLYSADNELLATAKLSEPLRKDPTNELFLRVRLDY